MLPWKTIISLDPEAERPIYLQIVDAIITEIKRGIIKPGARMPGTRSMAGELEIHRQTVVKAYDELFAQGWFDFIKSKGTFVSSSLPEIKPKKWSEEDTAKFTSSKTGFTFKINSSIHPPAKPNRHITGFHDGPDVRLVPAALIGRYYKSVLSRKSGQLLLSYTDVEGSVFVRSTLSEYLNTTHGLQTTADQILITRGTQMALYLLAQVLFEKGDHLITAEPGFRYADLTFLNAGIKLLHVPVDDEGIDVDAVEKVCKRKKIRAIYVTSHHHYPTTVTLCAARRMKLLQLSEKYGFLIIEDDYDYEFHYESSPILPLASADHEGRVIYIGSFSKTISPGIRIGYIAAPAELLTELAKLRMLIDVQGESVMEQVIAELLRDGEIRRHMKKSLKQYRERRDFMCAELKDKLSDVIHFTIPQGGLSIWAQFDKKVPVPELSEQLFKKNIILSKGLLHDASSGKKLNSTRMGFGWMNVKEAEKAISILHNTIRSMKH